MTVLHKKEIKKETMDRLFFWFLEIQSYKEIIESDSKFMDIAKMYYLIWIIYMYIFL